MKISDSVVLLVLITLLSCHSSRKTQQPVVTAPTPAPVKPIENKPDKEPVTKTDDFLADLLRKNAPLVNQLLKDRDTLRIQIIYTQIDRQPDNTPRFTDYYYNVNADKYFYPASTVKLPVALLSLQRLNELKVFGLNAKSTMITEAAYSGQVPTFNEPGAEDGRPSISQYIKKIFLVSDNDAYNRLYEFLGQEYINSQLKKMGYDHAQILHRLEIFLSEDENRHTNPIKFLTSDGRSVYQQPMQFNQQKYPPRYDFLGNAYYTQDVLVRQPMNFSKKNRIALEELHNILKSVIFPEAVPAKQRFNLKPEDYSFVLKYMSQFPQETRFPDYDSTNYWDAYVKFLLYGNRKENLPKQIRIFNKVGDAYGFLTDVAYVVDLEKNIEFMLSATIYCNSKGIINNDDYDYETIGLPFMKQLGETMYNYELKRERKVKPDLSKFKIIYDK